MADKEVLEAIDRVAEKIDRVDTKVDRSNARLDTLATRMDVLVETTNHRLDEFTKKIDGKLDDGQLLTSVGFKLLNNKVIRWGFGVLAAALAGTTIWSHWANHMPEWLGF